MARHLLRNKQQCVAYNRSSEPPQELAQVGATGEGSSETGVRRPPYEKLKLISTRKSMGVGSPSRIVGSYFLLETALSAAGMSSGCPLTTRMPFTSPCSSITASITTMPESRDWRASTGYSGAGPNSRRGGFTAPPTRTGALDPAAAGGGGATAFGIPPSTPPSTPPT